MESRRNIFFIRHKPADLHAFLVASGDRVKVKGTGLTINISDWEECSDLLLLFSWSRVRKEGKSNFTELKWTIEWWEKG